MNTHDGMQTHCNESNLTKIQLLSTVGEKLEIFHCKANENLLFPQKLINPEGFSKFKMLLN